MTAAAQEDGHSIKLSLTAADSNSGIADVVWSYKESNNGSWQTTTTQKHDKNTATTDCGQKNETVECTITGLKEGTKYQVKAKVEDVAGNSSTETAETTVTTQTTGITPTKENYGEYVDYGIDINGNSNTTDDWRVFYVGQQEDGEANGRIFLIAADYVAHTCSALSTAISNSGMTKYYDSNYETYYWNTPPTYHCNDGHNPGSYSSKAQCSFPELFMPANKYCDSSHRYFCSDHTNYTNSQCASRLQCTDDWKTFAKGGYAEYAIGGPTLNMWVESWNTKHSNERTLYANGQSSTYGYYVGTSASATTTYQNLSSCTSGYNDTLYFPHQTYQNDLDNDQQQETCYGYWLASPSAYNNRCLMGVDYLGGVSNGGYNYGDNLRRASCSLSKNLFFI